MACAGSQQPFRVDLKFLDLLREKLQANPALGGTVEGKQIAVTALAGRPALIVDVGTEHNHHRSIFAYGSSGHALGLDLTARMNKDEGQAVSINFEGCFVHLEREEKKNYNFTGSIKANDTSNQATPIVAFNITDIPWDLFPIHINWQALLACAPGCFACQRNIACWLLCAANCFVSAT